MCNLYHKSVSNSHPTSLHRFQISIHQLTDSSENGMYYRKDDHLQLSLLFLGYRYLILMLSHTLLGVEGSLSIQRYKYSTVHAISLVQHVTILRHGEHQASRNADGLRVSFM